MMRDTLSQLLTSAMAICLVVSISGCVPFDGTYYGGGCHYQWSNGIRVRVCDGPGPDIHTRHYHPRPHYRSRVRPHVRPHVRANDHPHVKPHQSIDVKVH